MCGGPSANGRAAQECAPNCAAPNCAPNWAPNCAPSCAERLRAPALTRLYAFVIMFVSKTSTCGLMPVSVKRCAMSFVSFASFWYTIGPRLTEPGV